MCPLLMLIEYMEIKLLNKLDTGLTMGLHNRSFAGFLSKTVH